MSICYKSTVVKALSRMTVLWGLADGILSKECPLLLPLLSLLVVLVGLGTFLGEAPPRDPSGICTVQTPSELTALCIGTCPIHLAASPPISSPSPGVTLHVPSGILLLLVSPGNGHRSLALFLVRMDEDCKDKWVLPFMYFYLSTALSSFPTTLLNLIILMYPPIRAAVLKP